MSKDYKRAGAQKRGRQGGQRNHRQAVAVLAGLLSVGGLISLYGHLGDQASAPMAENIPVDVVPSTATEDPRIALEPARPPGFAFYRDLPEREVQARGSDLDLYQAPLPPDLVETATPPRQHTVPPPTAAAVAAPPPTRSATPAPTRSIEPPTSTGRYVVQAGSFREMRHAQSMQAELTLMGYSTHQRTVRASSGQSLTQVRLGPYASRSEAEHVKQRLQSRGISAMVTR